MRVLLTSSEVHPYSKSGGLADMVGALGKALAKAGHDVGIVTPLYAGITQRFPDLKKLDWWMELPLGAGKFQAEVWTLNPAPHLTIYFVRNDGFYDRGSLYQENGMSYPDNPERFIFFSKAAVHLARHLPFQPEVVHAHDWQCGLVPLLILHQRWNDGWVTAPRTCFTIHNLAYQGQFLAETYALANLPDWYFNLNGAELNGALNCLKAGICYADLITTVSPRYAREITTPQFGCGLDGVLRARHLSLAGILNGVDYEEWTTVGNPFLGHSYSQDDLSGKEAIKLELQAEQGLTQNPDVPLFANITRLADQKGADIQLGALEEMLPTQMQFVLLGSGSPDLERAYQRLARRFPGKTAIHIGFNQALSHRIEAGADFFLMPSKYEPCGLNQMYSQRYGTIPIVRVTGGLDDSVVDITENRELATGIKFIEFSPRALSKSIRKALALYAVPSLLHHYRVNAMNHDFSWDKTQDRYAQIYERMSGAPAKR